MNVPIGFRNTQALLILGASALLLAQPLCAGADSSESMAGALRGITLDVAGTPVPAALVTIHRIQGGDDRDVLSGSDGVFTAAGLQPGAYRITASKDKFGAALPATVEIVQKQTTIARLQFAAADTDPAPAKTGSVPAAAPGPAPKANSPMDASAIEQELQAMRERMAVLEAALKAQTAVAPAANDAPALATAKPEETVAEAATVQQPAPAPQATPPVDMITPFADHDWTWLNGNSRQHDSPLDTKYFSGEFRADTFYGVDFNQPKDHSMGGSSEVFRNGEVQLEDLSIGGDFHAGNMRGRVLMLFGMFSATTVRNDASPAVGQWDVRAAYKYVSEAYGGYHFNVNHGLNIDAGIFVSYVGLFSYHNFDNWAYQPSYVSSNTPWFFNGVRIQWFPTHHLKIEPWFINGWQSYNKYNSHPGLGGQLKWTPNSWMTVIANQYGFGEDNVGLPRRTRYHTDDSIEIKYYDHPKVGNGIDRIAFTFTGDLGCETGNGVSCAGDHPYNSVTGKGGPKQSFVGYMAYNRWWWHKDLLAFTLGGGEINNPGRYLTLVLPVNGADAISGTPYFPAYPGAPFKAYDGTATFDWMPSQFVTFRTEFGFRHANVPYWSGRGGITPPGGNNGSPQNYVCNTGVTAGTSDLTAAYAACGGAGTVWFPDLRRGQALWSISVMVKL